MRILKIQETCGGLGAQCPTGMENNVANMLYAIQRKKLICIKKGQFPSWSVDGTSRMRSPFEKALFLGGENDKFALSAEIVPQAAPQNP